MGNTVYIYIMDYSVSKIFEYRTTQDAIDKYDNMEDFLMSRNININTCSFMTTDEKIYDIELYGEL